MDAGSLSLLYRLASMGAYSLLQYVGQSYPWSAEKSLATIVPAPRALRVQMTARPTGPQPITIRSKSSLLATRTSRCGLQRVFSRRGFQASLDQANSVESGKV